MTEVYLLSVLFYGYADTFPLGWLTSTGTHPYPLHSWELSF